MGDGSSPCSLSRTGIRRTLRGCQLPDAILHGKRSYRPRSRAVRHLAVAGLSSEAFQLAWAGGCATGLRTRSRHVCDLHFASSPLSAGSATAFDGAFARCHGSRLLTLRLPFVSQVSGVVFNIADAWKVFTGPAEIPCPSRCERSLCPPFGVFLWAVSLWMTARAGRTVLMHSSNCLPSG